MNLSELLSVERVIPQLEATEQWSVIDEVVAHLDGLGELGGGAPGEMVRLLREREERISTGIGSGVAVPHAFTGEVDEVVAAFGRSAEGIDFEAFDNAPVEFVLLLLVPEGKATEHLKTLAAVGKFFSDGNTRDLLREAAGREEIFAVFRDRALS